MDRLSSPLTLAVALVVGAWATGGAPRAVAADAPEPPSLADRQAFQAAHRYLPGSVLRPRPIALAGQDDVDVQRYDLSLFLDVAATRIEGRNVVTFVAAPGSGQATELVLDLYDNMAVSSVTRDGAPLDLATVTHASNLLHVPLVPPLPEGASPAVVVIDYAGQPAVYSFGTLTFGTHGDPSQPMIWTLSEPFLGRGWWPCKDVPGDKALVSVAVEAPDGLTVVSNGTQQSAVPGRPGFTVTTWREAHPISTYLVTVSATNYVTWSDPYLAQDGTTTMPVSYWAWPEVESQAREDWSITPSAIDFYAKSWTEYPFLDEKYGQVAVPLWGGMEHQTATSYGGQLLTGDHRFDFVVVHELAHQWWGDHVGPRTFESIWINEGFASYCEALWWEHLYGRAAYHGYMNRFDVLPARGTDFPGTVQRPDDYFNETVYDKGAWVLHMLRWVAGGSTDPAPEPLFAILAAHDREHADGIADTDDFIATAQRVSGLDLSWFFDEWLNHPGRPYYQVGWSSAPQPGGGWVTHLRVRQVQPVPTIFRMPVLVRIAYPSGAQVEQVVTDDLQQQDFTFPSPEPATSVGWDPDGWVLKRVSYVSVDRDADGWPDWLDGCPDVPNPAQEDADADGVQDACQAGRDFDGDGTLNESDCAPADPGAWSEPATETLLKLVHVSGPSVRFLFASPAPGGQAAYVNDVGHGLLAQLRASGAAGATCLQRAAPQAWQDDSAVSAGGDFYLAWPWNGCGPRATDGTWASPCR